MGLPTSPPPTYQKKRLWCACKVRHLEFVVGLVTMISLLTVSRRAILGCLEAGGGQEC